MDGSGPFLVVFLIIYSIKHSTKVIWIQGVYSKDPTTSFDVTLKYPNLEMLEKSKP